jgi:hypothetical protein
MHTTMLASCFWNTASHCVLLLLSLARTPPPGSWCIMATRTLGLMVQWLGPWVCLSHLVSWYIAIAIAIGNTESYSPQPPAAQATTLGIMLLCIIILITTLKLLIFNPSDEMKVADTDIVDSCLLATAKDGGIIVIIICLFLAT